MSYVKRFEHDIFVSYSSVDNDVLVKDGDKTVGWVDLLVDRLRRDLNTQLGDRDTNIELDTEFIRSNRPITTQLLDKVRNSAVLLVILSPGYLKSVWCARERDNFLAIAKDRVASGRVFVIRVLPIAREEEPEELRDLRAIDFFAPDAGSLAHPRLGVPDPYDRSFLERVDKLSAELAVQLKTMVTSAPVSRPKVYVAPATDDLYDRNLELENYVKQAGFDVLPSAQSRYPEADRESFAAAVLEDLGQCCLFAQLLSDVPGRPAFFASDRRCPVLFHDLAARAKKPVLQWRKSSLDVQSVTNPEHKALLDAAQACGLEEFKQRVVARALELTRPPAPTRPEPTPGVSVVFVNADVPDHGLAREISAALSERGVDCYWTPESGSPEEVRLSLEDNLRNCDGLVLVYGKTHLDWVQQQLRFARKMNGTRAAPLATLAIFEGPPPEKSEIPATIKNLVLLDCRKGLDQGKLDQFVSRLHS